MQWMCELRDRVKRHQGALRSLIFFLLVSVTLNAQTNKARHTFYSVQDGLSNYWVNCLYQDRQGFLWIGTQEGLNRFDGYSFRQYVFRSDTDSSNRRNCIWSIAEDEEGNIWAGTVNGLDRYDRKRDSITHFRHDPGNPNSLSADNIGSLHMAADGNLWIGTGGGLNILNTRRVNDKIARGEYAGNEFKVLKHLHGNPRSSAGDFIGYVYGDRRGRIWIFSGAGVDMYDPRKNAWRHFVTGSTRARGSVYEDGNGNIWIAHGGLHRIDAASQQMHTVSNIEISNVVPDGNGGLLLTGADVVYRFSTDSINANGLSKYDWSVQHTQRTITACLRDRAGSLWLGTVRGLVKRDDEFSWFSVIKASPPALHKNFHVTSFCESEDGSILVGTFGQGIQRMRQTDTTIRMTLKTTPSSLLLRAENNIFTIRKSSGHRYSVCSGAGLYFLSSDLKRKERVGYIPADPIPKLGVAFFTFEDPPDNLWFAVAGGKPPQLFRYDMRKRVIDSTGILQQRLRKICNTYIWIIHKDKRGRMWLGMDNGLCCFDPSDSSLQHFTNAPDDPASLSSNLIRSILEDSRGTIYIGTWGGGMNVFDEQTQTFARYAKGNGLADNTVAGMLEDGRGNIWIATNFGLSRFNPDTRRISNHYNEEIQSLGFLHSHAYMKSRDGRFLFGGNGVLSFHPDKIPWDSTFATIMVTSFSVSGKEIRSEIGSGEKISVPWQNNYFMLEYAALEFRAPEKIQYAYMLEGINTDWVYSGTQRSCFFSNVPPGDYMLRIKATNSNGEWNGKVFSMAIRIVPPVYMTSWFKWTAGILVILCLVLLWKLRLKHLKKKEQEKRNLIEAELHALRLQINPHFFFNSLNAIQSFVMGSEEELANEYISKFARLMRMVLETSRLRTIPLADELGMLELYLELESIRYNGRFQYHIDQDTVIDSAVKIPSMLIQPYAENAIRHGLQRCAGGGVLTITVKQDDDMLFCVVEDNGIGRELAMEMRRRRPANHTSLGASITSDRIEVLNSLRQRKLSVRTIDLYDEHHAPAGTRVEITVPLDEAQGSRYAKRFRRPPQPESPHAR